jgi:hypothetical protein
MVEFDQVCYSALAALSGHPNSFAFTFSSRDQLFKIRPKFLIPSSTTFEGGMRLIRAPGGLPDLSEVIVKDASSQHERVTVKGGVMCRCSAHFQRE